MFPDDCSECDGRGGFDAFSYGGVIEVPCEFCNGTGERQAWDGTGDLWGGWEAAP